MEPLGCSESAALALPLRGSLAAGAGRTASRCLPARGLRAWRVMPGVASWGRRGLAGLELAGLGRSLRALKELGRGSRLRNHLVFLLLELKKAVVEHFRRYFVMAVVVLAQV